MTQSELAERTQTTKSYISKIENGVSYHPKCRRFLSYHCSPWNEGGSGEACVLSIQNLLNHWTVL